MFAGKARGRVRGRRMMGDRAGVVMRVRLSLLIHWRSRLDSLLLVGGARGRVSWCLSVDCPHLKVSNREGK